MHIKSDSVPAIRGDALDDATLIAALEDAGYDAQRAA